MIEVLILAELEVSESMAAPFISKQNICIDAKGHHRHVQQHCV